MGFVSTNRLSASDSRIAVRHDHLHLSPRNRAPLPAIDDARAPLVAQADIASHEQHGCSEGRAR